MSRWGSGRAYGPTVFTVRMDSIVVTVRTGARRAVVDLTAEVAEFCRGRGDGLVSVFVHHGDRRG